MKTNFHSLNHKNSSVKRQKGESQNGVSRKQSTSKFPKNEHFLLPDTHTYVCVPGGKKCSFFGKFDVLCFLETCFQGRPFALLPTNYSNSTKLVELIFDKLRSNGLTQTKETKLNKLETKTSHGWSTTFGLKRTKLPGNNFKNPGPLTCCSERDLKKSSFKIQI